MDRKAADLLKEVPLHCVYQLCDEAGTVFYVGSTCTMHLRLSQHLRKPYGPRIASVEVVVGLTKREARSQERILIETLAPEHNKQRVLVY